ncbi:MAG: hypothetical protein LQ352_002402 [Teloschistes flavicans]|nr:MAG: hypothetical protein LQ352_002402 [Teloschistes flavicans]
MSFNHPAHPKEDSPSESDVSRGWTRQAQQADRELGFRNPQFRCYLNSVVIALLHSPKFVNFLEAHASSTQEHVVVVKDACVVCALAGLSSEYWRRIRKDLKVEQKLDVFLDLLDAGGFGEEIDAWPKRKQESIQQDASDFYLWLLSVIQYQIQETRSPAGKDRVEELFGISIRTLATCFGCYERTRRHEPKEKVLILTCDKGKIDEAINTYFVTEELSGIDCESDKCNMAKQKKCYVKKLTQGPDILCTQFNRFEKVLDKKRVQKTQKNKRRVSYGESLNLTRFVENGAPLQYRLVAAIHHQGDLNKGHYITTARTPRELWAEYDNATVKRVDSEHALQPSDFTPYLLFWQKERLTTPTSTTVVPPETSPNPKKRPHEYSNSAADSEIGRPRIKSPKHTGTSPADNNPPNEEQPDSGPSRWGRWRSNWLFGRLAAADLEAQRVAKAKRALAHCQKEHKQCQEEHKRRELFICRAALTHAQLIKTINHLSTGLDAANKVMRTVSPFMEQVHDRGEHPEIVKPFLEAQKAVTRARVRDRRLGSKSQRYRDLVRPVKNGKGMVMNAAIKAFCDNVKEAREAGLLESWFDAELKRLALPEDNE